MKTVGIVAEYNPLHIGHKSHLAKSKESSGAEVVIVVMSGNFVQRGEPAIMDKWQRTQKALEAGADLVIELPLYYAAAGAEYFARGAVSLLEKSGIVDSMCFGSEWADMEALRECALLEEDEGFKVRMRGFLKQGLSYPAARAKAADIRLPDTPNNILGVEYIKALAAMGSGIEPIAIPRYPGISAKEVRASLKGQGFADFDHLSTVFRYALLREEPQSCIDVSEGLENRLKHCDSGLISETIAKAKTKRYTYLRIQRAVLHIILGMTKGNLADYEAAGGPQYIRVLGFNRKRVGLLKLLEERAALPVVVNLKNAKLPPLAAQMLEEEVCSSKIYSLAWPVYKCFNEYTCGIIWK